MNNIKSFIDSGILESYVLGMTDAAEEREVQRMAYNHTEVREAIASLSEQIEKQAFANAVAPPVTVKPLLLATIDYMERMEKGEEPSFPPALQPLSTIKDYEVWLSREDMMLPEDFTDFHAKIIGHTPACTTAIVWIKKMAPNEVHNDELEKFLIVEGTCTITIEETTHQLKAGDFLSIPLHKNHFVEVTSHIPCKAILQRAAA